jgi:hypothetical protein
MNVPEKQNPNNVKNFVKPIATKINSFSMPHATNTVQQYSCRG